MKLTLQRRYKGNDYTIGTMLVDGVRFSDTLEDTDRGLTDTMSTAAIRFRKIFGKTAIPTGTYEVKLTVSPKFKDRAWAARYGGLVPEIKGVKGFSGIRIHPGTDQYSTDGCPLVGENKVRGKVINSQATYFKLMDDHLMPAFRRGEKMYITVK